MCHDSNFLKKFKINSECSYFFFWVRNSNSIRCPLIFKHYVNGTNCLLLYEAIVRLARIQIKEKKVS